MSLSWLIKSFAHEQIPSVQIAEWHEWKETQEEEAKIVNRWLLHMSLLMSNTLANLDWGFIETLLLLLSLSRLIFLVFLNFFFCSLYLFISGGLTIFFLTYSSLRMCFSFTNPPIGLQRIISMHWVILHIRLDERVTANVYSTKNAEFIGFIQSGMQLSFFCCCTFLNCSSRFFRE